MTDLLAGDRLLTPAEARERLGLSVNALLHRATTGHIPCVRTPTGHRRYRASDIDAARAEEVEATIHAAALGTYVRTKGGKRVHLSSCHHVQRSDAVGWRWAESRSVEEIRAAVTRGRLLLCGVCRPLAGAGAR